MALLLGVMGPCCMQDVLHDGDVCAQSFFTCGVITVFVGGEEEVGGRGVEVENGECSDCPVKHVQCNHPPTYTHVHGECIKQLCYLCTCTLLYVCHMLLV